MTGADAVDRFGADQFLVFLHMPKTGGRSVTQLLDRTFGEDLCPHKRWQDIIAHRHELTRYRALRGHIFAAVLNLIGQRAIGAAFFRDPIDRVISEYRFIRRNPDHGRHAIVSRQSLLEFVSSANNLRVYSRFLGFAPEDGDYSRMRQTVPDDELLAICKHRIDTLGFIGMTETFEKDFRSLERWLGADGAEPVPHANVDPGHRPEPSADVVARIREVGWMDVEIYDYAKSVACGGSWPARPLPR